MIGRIGELFPLGGPVPPALIIGRTGELDEIERRLREGVHTMLVGPRRIGKTTVCAGVCERLRGDGISVIDVEVPERPHAESLLQSIVDRCNTVSATVARRRAFRTARPFVQQVLADHGIPLDLSELGAEPGAFPSHAVLSLPRTIAEETGRPVVLFLDELQRAVAYADGDQLLGDLVDLYGGATDVAILVDGSEERVLDGMLGPPVHFGKLCGRLSLDPTIPRNTWRRSLTERFERAGMRLDETACELLLAFGDGRPYETIAAARYAALTARKLDGTKQVANVGEFEARMGIDAASRHLEDDGVSR